MSEWFRRAWDWMIESFAAGAVAHGVLFSEEDKTLPSVVISGHPLPIDSFFETGLCPDCGHAKFYRAEDGGHDVLLECANCHSKFGVQEAPFNIIERVSSQKHSYRYTDPDNHA